MGTRAFEMDRVAGCTLKDKGLPGCKMRKTAKDGICSAVHPPHIVEYLRADILRIEM